MKRTLYDRDAPMTPARFLGSIDTPCPYCDPMTPYQVVQIDADGGMSVVDHAGSCLRDAEARRGWEYERAHDTPAWRRWLLYAEQEGL